MTKKKSDDGKTGKTGAKHETVIEAAGAVIFRTAPSSASSASGDGTASDKGSAAGLDGLQILLEHRAKYDDWSIPKGKVDPRESLAHTAVREVAEETGVHIRLSARLGEVSYPLHLDGSEGSRDKNHKGGRHHRKTRLLKHVTYWAGVPISQGQTDRREEAFGHPNPKDNETDHLEWLGFDQARQRLTYPDDRAFLDRFRRFVEAGGDHAATLVFVRHGAAEKRRHWKWGEQTRPLTPEGAAESLALAREIACYAPSRLLSSPWRRCRQSLEMYAAQTGLAIEDLPQMTEEEAAANPPASAAAQEALLRDLASQGLSDRSSASAVACLHRPVLGMLLPLVKDMADAGMTGTIPDDSPWLATGTGLAVTVTRHEGRLTVLDAHPLAPVVY